MKPTTTTVKEPKRLKIKPRYTKEVFGDGKSQAYMSAWYDWNNEENRL